MTHNHRRRFLPLLLTASMLALVGCAALTPKPFTPEQETQRVQEDLAAIRKDSAPLTGPLSLQEAIARGLMYNLDAREALLEQTLQNHQLSLATYNMLPHLAAAAGYDTRNNFPAATSISLLTHQQSLEPSYSAEKNDLNANLTFTWNLLDFGLSYFQAKEEANQAMAAVERRRRVINNMVKQIEESYWRAVTAQRLLPQVESLEQQIGHALHLSQSIEQKKLQAPVATLEYRRNLLEVLINLKHLHTELAIAQAQLASLTGLPPGTPLILAEPSREQEVLPAIQLPMHNLQQYGLINRPELRETAYQQHSDEQEVNRAMLKMLPGLSVVGSLNYDSNRLLTYNDWHDIGARAAWDLINVAQGPEAIRTARTTAEITQMRRLALTQAVLAQVAISYSQYREDVETYNTSYDLFDVEKRIFKAANNARESSGTELDRIQKAAMALKAQLDCYRAFADAKAAYANLLVSVGYDLVPASADTKDLKTMVSIVNKAMNQVNGYMVQEPVSPPPVANKPVAPKK